jgi:histidinol dehydrogenase
MAARLDTSARDFAAKFDALVDARREATADVGAAVAAILGDVRARGDDAVAEYTARFDGWRGPIAVAKAEINAARRDCDPETLAALELAAERIRDYHIRQLPKNIDYTDDRGIRLGARWSAIAAVGIYVPGGTAAYPSSVLMNAVPAGVAGVKRIVMTVPAPNGALNLDVLAAASVAGVSEIYRIGGAQAVGALAYGTRTIAPVDKIVGPGNAYVAEAKRQVFGVVGIDMIAGPSEVVVVADAANDPAWIAADLLAQAEHDAAAQSILVTDDARFADVVAAAVDTQLAQLPRASTARASWDGHGAIVLVRDLREAAPLIDRLAPEHLELAVARPDALAAAVTNTGAIFLGRHAPEAIGDYVAGPSHVLPTSRTARFASGLGVLDFMKRTSIIGCDAASVSAIGPAAVTLANAEGLEAHATSVALRLGRRNRR